MMLAVLAYLRRVLSRKELATLVRTGQLRQVLALLNVADTPASATVSHKSILLARHEKRKGTEQAAAQAAKTAKISRLPQYAQQTENRNNYNDWGSLHGGKEGGEGTYWEQVCARRGAGRVRRVRRL